MLRQIPPGKRVGGRRNFPFKIATREAFDATVENGVLAGLVPDAPFISRDTPIVTFGSCFAENIARDLSASGYNTRLMHINERLFNAFALRDFVDGLGSKDSDLTSFESAWRLIPDQIIGTRTAIAAGAVVIVTLGLSFVWFDNDSGEMIFDPTRKVGPMAKLVLDNPGRFEMRATDVSENFDAIAGMIGGLRKLNPFTKIVLTLSPVPLHRAICDYPVMVADSISKATLRCALHQITMLGLKDVYYFPSYEILRGFASMVDVIWYEDNRLSHVQKRWIEYTMSKFKAAYCAGEQALPPPLPYP